MALPEPPAVDVIVKVGGSLYDLPDLGARLRHWLATLGTPFVLLVPGGGPVANVIRQLDRCHALGDEIAHWLALRALSLNAHFLSAVLGNALVVRDVDECRRLPPKCVAVLDGYAFAQADEGRSGCLPHSWDVTSDALAARAARVAGACRLILLKSITLPENLDWREASRRGFVDPFFAEAVAGAIAVEVVNFRALGKAS